MHTILEEVEGVYRIIALKSLRRTPGVKFDMVMLSSLLRIDAIDRVIHEGGAVSPGPVGDIERPWYMHTYQDDNLLVLHGTRHVEIYTPKHGQVEAFTVTADHVMRNGKVLHEGAAMLVWPRGVFHRIVSDPVEGSASLNLATHYDGFDIATNFSIYDLNTETGESRVIRKGSLDQP
ncbi:MAG: hypothetical protein HN341_16980 [Verrucomicrobia bacterium]|jgi:hypothetical protein|nr:hypothetical protein [Verrucomicrobiota bacterium]